MQLFWQTHKNRLGTCGMQLAALVTRRIGPMQQGALVACIILEYLLATKEHFACCPKWWLAVRSIP